MFSSLASCPFTSTPNIYLGVTLAAYTLTFLFQCPSDEISHDEWVSLWTVCLVRILVGDICWREIHEMLSTRYRSYVFMMLAYAHSIFADVMKLLAFGNWSLKQFMSNLVSIARFVAELKTAASTFGWRGIEIPTTCHRINDDFFLESFQYVACRVPHFTAARMTCSTFPFDETVDIDRSFKAAATAAEPISLAQKLYAGPVAEFIAAFQMVFHSCSVSRSVSFV